MSDATVIEIQGDAVGIVARTRAGFTFYAAVQPFYVLERRLYRSPRHVEKAARDLLERRKPAVSAHSSAPAIQGAA